MIFKGIAHIFSKNLEAFVSIYKLKCLKRDCLEGLECHLVQTRFCPWSDHECCHIWKPQLTTFRGLSSLRKNNWLLCKDSSSQTGPKVSHLNCSNVKFLVLGLKGGLWYSRGCSAEILNLDFAVSGRNCEEVTNLFSLNDFMAIEVRPLDTNVLLQWSTHNCYFTYTFTKMSAMGHAGL